MPRASYANVTATIALVVAMAGGAYAAGIGRNDVKSRNIAPRAVKTSDLANDAVKTGKIAPDAVTGAQLAESTLGIVPNADQLDGLDSGAFLRGGGSMRSLRGTDDFSGGPSAPIPLDIGGTLTANCNNPASAPSELTFTNTSGAPIDVWLDRFQDFGTTMQLNYTSLGPGGGTSLSISGPAVSSGHAFGRFTISSGNRVTLIEARLIAGAGACQFPLLITELNG